MKKRLYTATSVLILLALWAGLTHTRWANPFFFPAPERVWGAGRELWQSGELMEAWRASFGRVLLGFALAVALGTALGLACASSRPVRWLTEPWLQLTRPIPPIAWMPLAILWFGLGHGPAVFLTTVAAFFPIFLNVYFGVTQIDTKHILLSRSFGANTWLHLRFVIWPATWPAALNGYRVGFGMAWMATMAAEMLATPSGLGYLISTSQNLMRTDRVVLGMGLIGLTGWACDRAFQRLHARAEAWR